MARFTTAGGSGDGTPGAPGPAGSNGADGADALWNYTGEYNGGASYAVGDLVTYDGQLWYRANANGGNVGDTPSQGYIWNLLAAKGADGTNGSSGLVYLGNYISGNGYVTDLAVVRGSDNNLYIAKASGGLADPVGNTAEWDIFSTNTGGGTANIADFIFTNDSENTGRSIISLPGDKGMTIEAGVDSDLYITAGDDLYIQTLGQGDDIHLNAADDIRFTTNNEDAEFETVHNWSMDSEGRFQLPGSGYISNPIDSSGDGYGNDTIVLTPDTENGSSDQQIIIDPTAPNHIHIRAGGVQDYSSAELILGGERAGVHVSDASGNVNIQAKKEDLSWSYDNINDIEGTVFRVNTSVAEPDYNDFMIYDGIKYIINNVTRSQVDNITEYSAISSTGTQFSFFPGWNYTFKRAMGEWYWTFNEDGYIIGPAEGDLFVNGIVKDNGGDLYIIAQEGGSVVLDGYGEFLNDHTIPSNQIATIGDVTTAVGVGGNGEVTRWSPNFTATGLVFTGTDTTYPTYNSHYVKNGRMVSFWIAIDLSTVTNFGTGQYITALPYAPLAGTMNHFQAWANVDPTVNPDIAGHVVLQADHLANTTQLDLHYLKQAGGANSPLMEAMFTQDAPAELTTSSKIYINGTYITAE
jgi:hypothetical protein